MLNCNRVEALFCNVLRFTVLASENESLSKEIELLKALGASQTSQTKKETTFTCKLGKTSHRYPSSNYYWFLYSNAIFMIGGWVGR